MFKTALLISALLLATFSLAAADEQFSLADTDWAVRHCDDTGLRILDVRQGIVDYLAGHVPNAVHFPDNSLRGPHNGMPAQFLTSSLMQQLLLRAGVRDGEPILIYSEGENVLGATMVAYVLERLGHSNVMVLDGGWAAFKQSGRSTPTYANYKPGIMTVKDKPGVRVDLDEVKNLIGQPGVAFIDARPNKLYTGEVTTWMRNGHIPGAINIDWHELVDAANPHKFKTAAQLKPIYEAKGIKKSDDIIVYCSTGREATLEYAVLKHMLNYPNVRLYEGSWTEYCSHPECKVETGNPDAPAAASDAK